MDCELVATCLISDGIESHLDLFTDWSVYLNWDEDRLEVSSLFDADEIKVESAKFYFSRHQDERVELRVIGEVNTSDGELSANISTFDQVLRLFSAYAREFEIDLIFVYESQKYQTTYAAALPMFVMRFVASCCCQYFKTYHTNSHSTHLTVTLLTMKNVNSVCSIRWKLAEMS